MPKVDHSSFVSSALMSIGESELSAAERRRLKRRSEWEALVAVNGADATEVGVCVDTVRSWRRIDRLRADVKASSVDPSARPRLLARSIGTWEIASNDDEALEFRAAEVDRVVAIADVASWVTRAQTSERRRTGRSSWLQYTVPNGVAQVKVRDGGKLSRLHYTSGRLAHRYGWTQAGGVDFLLADAAPLVEQVKVSTRRPASGRRVVLDCDPHASPKDVLEAYRSAQRMVEVAVGPTAETFDLLSEWLVMGRPGFDEFAATWSSERRTTLSPEACRQRIRRAEASLGLRRS